MAKQKQLSDVARHAGVSPATASRVLNGVPTVQESNRKRVLEAAAELNYRPNRVARNLRRQRADIIGAVISDIENPHFATMIRALEDAAYHRGGRLLLCNTDEDAGKQRAYLAALASERVLGVVVSATDPSDPEISHLLDLGIPVVAFDRPAVDPRADGVFVDNELGGRLATEHLLRAGHSRVGFIGGPPGVSTADGRRSGYERAMSAAGLETVTANGLFRLEGGQAATARLLDETPDLTALVVANNLMSLGMLEGLRPRGLAREIATVTIDDPFWATLVEPALTTLAQPVRQMSGAAAELLFERIRGERSVPRACLFPFTLHVRDSCGTSPPGGWRDEPELIETEPELTETGSAA